MDTRWGCRGKTRWECEEGKWGSIRWESHADDGEGKSELEQLAKNVVVSQDKGLPVTGKILA